MFDVVPTSVLIGAPVSCPDLLLKVAQRGESWTLNVSALPLGFDTVGVKLYTLPTTTLVAAVPEIVGGAGRCRRWCSSVGVVVDDGVVESPELWATAAKVLSEPARAPIMRRLTANSLAVAMSAARRRIKFFIWSRFNITVYFLMQGNP
jgi:hypothetical protein